MFDFIFEIVCGDKYNVMVLTVKDGVLYGIPCDECMSGDYPVINEKVKLSEAKICDFDLDEKDAIKISKHGNQIDIKLSNDSWDGYQ